MSPALLQEVPRGGAAGRRAPRARSRTGFAFAPHPVVTDTDRDKYCVQRIIDFYQRQPTDFADYFLAAWRFRHRAALGQPDATLADIAAEDGVSPKYLATVWSALTEAPERRRADGRSCRRCGASCRRRTASSRTPRGPAASDARLRRAAAAEAGAEVQEPGRARASTTARSPSCCGRTASTRPTGARMPARGAAGRRATRMSRQPIRDLAVPGRRAERARYEAAFERFCDVFPDAFFVSERGRDYVGKAKDQQEKGRLLSAGFHSMMGYFRDDGPLCELILDERAAGRARRALAGARFRRLGAACGSTRTSSASSGPTRASCASRSSTSPAPRTRTSTSEAKIKRLAEVYLAKAQRQRRRQARRMRGDRRLLPRDQRPASAGSSRRGWRRSRATSRRSSTFAERAYRRPLTPAERDDLARVLSLAAREGRAEPRRGRSATRSSAC